MQNEIQKEVQVEIQTVGSIYGQQHFSPRMDADIFTAHYIYTRGF